MNRWPSRVMLVLLVLALTASTVDAQRRARRRSIASASGPTYGAHLGYNFDVDDLLVGAQLTYPITPVLALYPTFDYYFVSPGSLWSLNFDLKYRPRRGMELGMWAAGSTTARPRAAATRG